MNHWMRLKAVAERSSGASGKPVAHAELAFTAERDRLLAVVQRAGAEPNGGSPDPRGRVLSRGGEGS
jgi:hypothetical protein